MTNRSISVAEARSSKSIISNSSANKQHSSRQVLGLIFLAVCIASDIIEAASLRSLQTDQSYRKPFFLLWMSQSAFTIILPASVVWLLWQEHKQSGYQPILASSVSPISGTRASDDGWLWSSLRFISWLPSLLRPSLVSHGMHLYKQHTVHLYRRSFTHFVLISACLSVFHLGILYIWYIALGSTTVGQVSAIFNTSCFFTYIFSLWILKQKSESRKLLAVVSSVLGILVITLEDTPWSFSDAENVGDLSTTDAAAVASHTASAGSSEGETGLVLSAMWANALLALSAVCYGLYEVIFAKYSTPSTTPDSADRNEMNGVTSSPSKRMDSSAHHHGEVEEESLFLANQIIGFIGLTTIFIWWIPLVILDQTGLERFGLPEDQHIWMLIGLDIVCSFIHNTLYMLTITLIGPVFASIGATLIIPFGVLADYVMWQELSFGQQGLVGCLLIMVGFALFLAQNLNLPMGFFIKQIFISPVHFLYSKLASLIFPTKISRRKSGSTNSPVTGPQQRKSIITNSAADEHSIKPGKI